MIDEILSFSNQIHELKLEYINEKLKQNFKLFVVCPIDTENQSIPQ